MPEQNNALDCCWSLVRLCIAIRSNFDGLDVNMCCCSVQTALKWWLVWVALAFVTSQHRRLALLHAAACMHHFAGGPHSEAALSILRQKNTCLAQLRMPRATWANNCNLAEATVLLFMIAKYDNWSGSDLHSWTDDLALPGQGRHDRWTEVKRMKRVWCHGPEIASLDMWYD